MDETKGTEQGTPQTTGQSSDGQTGSTSNEPEAYTKEQVAKQVSDELAKAGRDAKSLEKRESGLKAQQDAIKAETDKVAKWQADRDAEELEAARDNPELLTLAQRKKTLRDAEAKLAEDRAAFDKDKADTEQELKDARDAKRDITIWRIAGDKLDAAKLKELCDKLNAQTEEQIQAIADSLSPSGETKPGETKPGLKPDSSATLGSGQDYTSVSFAANAPSGKDMISEGLKKKT